jgi:type II secretory pathway pseudopilin PulG
MKKLMRNESGMALVLEIVLIAAVLSVVAGAVYMSNQAKSKQAAEKAKQEQLAQADAEAKKKAAMSPSPSASPSPTATATPTVPTATHKPATPKPTTPTPKPIAVHPTTASCLPNDGKFTVYASVAGGTKTYWDFAFTNPSGIVVAYGTAMTVHCVQGHGIEKLVYGETDSVVRASDVTTTKP